MTEKTQTRTVTLQTFEKVLLQWDEQMHKKVEALEAADKEGASIGFDMLSMKGAIGGIVFARKALFALIHEAADAHEAERAPKTKESAQQELPKEE